MVSYRVELDIFSGRPNPAWEMGARDVAQFETLLQRAIPQAGAVLRIPDLGYRGFLVFRPRPVRLFQGRIFSDAGSDANEVRLLLEPNLESWLLERGRPHLDEHVCRAVQDALGLKD